MWWWWWCVCVGCVESSLVLLSCLYHVQNVFVDIENDVHVHVQKLFIILVFKLIFTLILILLPILILRHRLY